VGLDGRALRIRQQDGKMERLAGFVARPARVAQRRPRPGEGLVRESGLRSAATGPFERLARGDRIEPAQPLESLV